MAANQDATHRGYLVNLGFYGVPDRETKDSKIKDRSNERLIWDIQFQKLQRNNRIDLTSFKANTLSHGFSRRIIEAAFRVFDPQRTGEISKYDYYLFWASCGSNFRFDRDNNTVLMQFRFQIIFNYYDQDCDGNLTRAELHEYIRDLSKGDMHVDSILARMGITEESSITLQRLTSPEMITTFNSFHLHSRDWATLFPKTEKIRVLLYDRTTEAHAHSDPSPITRFRGTGVGGLAGPPVTQHRTPDLRRLPSDIHPPEAVNEGCRIHGGLIPTSDWRGSLVDRDGGAFQLAGRIIEHARKMSMRTLAEPTDLSDSSWKRSGETFSELLDQPLPIDPRMIAQVYFTLAAECLRVVQNQPIVVNVPAPCKVFGDIHGQFRDLLLLFREFGFPSNRGGDVDAVSYVFNGDFVDRGQHQLEVVLLLFSLKIAYPSRVFLIRGNHEFREMNQAYGFYETCLSKFTIVPTASKPTTPEKSRRGSKITSNDEKLSFSRLGLGLDGLGGLAGSGVGGGGASTKLADNIPSSDLGDQVFECIHQTFDYLPLSAVVAHSILVLHGGIGHGEWKISDLLAVNRPIQIDHPFGVNPPMLAEAKARRPGVNPDEGLGVNEAHERLLASNDMNLVYQCLWSDPVGGNEMMNFGIHPNPQRGGEVMAFGSDLTKRFCDLNGLQMVIRSHQLVEKGYKIMHEGRLITVFSARNYHDGAENDAAILMIAFDEEGNLLCRPKHLSRRT